VLRPTARGTDWDPLVTSMAKAMSEPVQSVVPFTMSETVNLYAPSVVWQDESSSAWYAGASSILTSGGNTA
jgi:hypothetical protein